MALTKHPIADLIARRGGLVIDGAMSTPLEAAGLNLNDTLWSAKALLECPDLVRKVHYDYYAAGANAVEACSYQATEAAFARKGIEKAEASRLIRLSGELVREAKNDVLLEHPEWDPADLLTAGSIGPYGAYLADGSEYTGAYDLTREEYYVFHQLRLDELLNSGMAILAIETQPRFDEIEALLAMIADRDITCWVTVTLKDGDMPDGTKLEVLAKCLDADPHVEAFGFNCVKREWVEPGLKRLSAYTDKPLVVYPNSGETYDPTTKTWRAQGVHEPDWNHYVPLWEHTGARCIGGCCRTLPKDIVQIAELLHRAAEKH